MPNKKTKSKKASTRSRRSRRPKREVVVEETTRVVPARRHVVAVRKEPVTLSRALGEAAVVEGEAEPPVSRTVIRRRKIA